VINKKASSDKRKEVSIVYLIAIGFGKRFIFVTCVPLFCLEILVARQSSCFHVEVVRCVQNFSNLFQCRDNDGICYLHSVTCSWLLAFGYSRSVTCVVHLRHTKNA
jgi:hypothetical protein